MLILHRRVNEALCIDGGIRIVVLQSDGGGARLGIEAPQNITILREEIIREVGAENLRASQQDSTLLTELIPARPDTGE